jgi:hypothetical protein
MATNPLFIGDRDEQPLLSEILLKRGCPESIRARLFRSLGVSLMPIQYTCPHCQKQMEVDDKYAGQTGPCAACGQTITIPVEAAPPGKPNYAPTAAASGAGMSIAVILGVVLVGVLLCGGVLLALLLPAVQVTRKAAQRSQSTNNMRQIAIALHNYHDMFGMFPPAVVTDADGKPLYSGRVALLPFMEQQPLYDQWNKDKAWDSPENLPLSQITLPTFVDPAAGLATPGQTNYLFVTGGRTGLGTGKPQRLQDVVDGTSNTIFLVEVKNGANWAQPKELDAAQLANGLPPGNHRGGNLVGMLDGSVRFLSDSTDPGTIQALLTRNGGEVVELP